MKLVATDEDIKESYKVEKVLKDDYDQFESDADKNKKREILARL